MSSTRRRSRAPATTSDRPRVGSFPWRPATFSRLSRRRRPRTGSCSGARSFDWLCEQGHVGLERVAKARRDPALVGPVTAALEQLGAIYARLKGDVSVLHASRENLLLPVDLVHEPTGTVIEVDEPPHFTSFRLAALELYRRRRDAWGSTSTSTRSCAAPGARRPTASRAASPPRASASAGVQRERAYHDALLDLATPAMGHPPVVRIAAVDGDGAAAYRRHRASLLALLGWPQLAGASYPSITETLTVEQRPQRTRTFFVICTGCIDAARTLPHSTQT